MLYIRFINSFMCLILQCSKVAYIQPRCHVACFLLHVFLVFSSLIVSTVFHCIFMDFGFPSIKDPCLSALGFWFHSLTWQMGFYLFIIVTPVLRWHIINTYSSSFDDCSVCVCSPTPVRCLDQIHYDTRIINKHRESSLTNEYFKIVNNILNFSFKLAWKFNDTLCSSSSAAEWKCRY